MAPIEFPASPINGQSFSKWAWNNTQSVWGWNVTELINVEYVVVAGGAGGATAGGGAGGYRSNVIGESSGGGASAESILRFTAGDTATVTVGAGGTTIDTSSNDGQSGDGQPSQFASITTVGGGGGGGYSDTPSLRDGRSGGSGGGAGVRSTVAAGDPGDGTLNQGYNGGTAFLEASGSPAGGGGGAGGTGVAATAGVAGDGGPGIYSSITGSSVPRAGGGGGGSESAETPGSGGVGGGGAGISAPTGNDADPNTGGGGGGNFNGVSGAGGSGVVILRYSAEHTLTIGAGLTSTTDSVTVPGYKITTFTAGTDTVTFS